MKYYNNLFSKCEVLLLADVFDKIRNNNLKNYGLCLSHCLSAPSFIWDAMLKMKKTEVEIIQNPDMHIFF